MKIVLVSACIQMLLLASAVAWSEDDPSPAPADGRLVFGFPFSHHVRFGLSPFGGAGPFHFGALANLPYSERYKTVEYGVRLGLEWSLSDAVQLGFEAYTANPDVEASDGPRALTVQKPTGHLDAALGLSWRF